jgi:dTDP-4-amino-4,6-dideoxygalactose transaminase
VIPLSRPTVTPEMKQALLDVAESGWFILGPETREFEREFAAAIGTKHAVAVAHGTAAIQLSVAALGVRPGDEVLVPSMTAFPTIEAILHAGATPVMADVDRYGALDPADAAQRVTSRTVGIVPVHLWGGVADLDALGALARERGLWLLEDACQAHGARWGERMAGSIGRAGCFSFYPSKNVTVFGDGGMVVTDEDALAARIRSLRDHGRSDKYTHEEVGFNFRFNELQAAVGRRQLALLDSFVERRRAIAHRYDRALAGIPGLSTPLERPGTRMAYHLYPVRLETANAREALKQHLVRKEIETGIHYPVPSHLQPAMARRGGEPPPSLPESEAIAETSLSLPMFPALTDAEVDAVIGAVREFFSRQAAGERRRSEGIPA